MGFFNRSKKQNKAPEVKTEVSAGRHTADLPVNESELTKRIRALAEEFELKVIYERQPCKKEQFMALLAGISALRKTPGVPGPGGNRRDYFVTLPRCASPEAEAECRAHLEQIFGITDKQSLLTFCERSICCQRQYLDFVGFWEGQPPFEMNQLNEGARKFFEEAKEFSAQFYPVVGRKGYLAWDISECMGHLRAGYACGLLTKEELDEMAEHWIKQAQIFEGWEDFAVSVVCGELYWDFRQGARGAELEKGLDLWTRLIRILLENDAAWGSAMWYKG